MANLTVLSTIKQLIGGGVRPNLFEVNVPGVGITILCKAAALPGSSIGIIEIPMSGGRRYKVSGDRTFAEWTTTIILDPKYSTRRSFELLQSAAANISFEDSNLSSGKRELGDVTVKQFRYQANSLEETAAITYTLKNCFISDISAIDLSYDSTDAISEYTVTWVYDYHTTA
jgi:hypothetical protein